MAQITPLKLNTSGLVQPAQSGDVVSLIFGGVGKKYRGSIPQMSGTTIIAVGSTAPLVTDGSQLGAITVTPEVIGSNMNIEFACLIDTSTINAKVTLAVFKDSTLLGYVCSASTGRDGTNPASLAIRLDDTTTSLTPVVYSCRIGVTSGTWYINRGSVNTMGGMNKTSFSITEEF